MTRYRNGGTMAELPPLDNSLPALETVPPMGDGTALALDSPVEEAPKGKLPLVKGLLTWVWRWMLLGGGVSAAWVLGLVVAQFFPAQNANPPLQEVILRHGHRTGQKLQQLPQWWAGDRYGTSQSDVSAAPFVREPASTEATPRPIALSETQREQITVELGAIEGDLQRLRDRTSALETQLGLVSPSEPVEQRLETVTNRLDPSTEAVAGRDSAPSSRPAPAAPAAPQPATTDPLFAVEAYRVTLPGNLLFAPGEAILQSTAQQWLETILSDVGRYPGATILVGSHSDAEPSEDQIVDISFQQAMAVRRYLTERLGEEQYHWVSVGYGNSALSESSADQSQNWVTIAIVPQ
ncbi:MAG: OmpA family protein [Leptolyngbyaceae cyanobacterium]